MTQVFVSGNRSRTILVAALLLVCPALIPAQTPTVTILVNFAGSNGADPSAPALVQATNGELYGTTDQGGATSSGTLFDVTPLGSLTTLNSFCCQNNYVAGDAPSGLTQTSSGVLYGTTQLSGLAQCQIDPSQTAGCGTIFQVGPGGQLTSLYNFSGPDGFGPGGLIEGTDGNLYGTAFGTIFKFTPGFGLTILYNPSCTLEGCLNAIGAGSLIEGADGNFYGTSGNDSGGTIFEMTPQGTLTSLYVFTCSSTSCNADTPSSLMQASNGIFYGVTLEGGTDLGNSPCNEIGGVGGDGTIFEFTPGSAAVILHSFDGTDGAIPESPLIEASDGNLYGTTACGGANGAGTIFQITPAGVFTLLYSFTGSPVPGGGPSGLFQATNGLLYGTTPNEGTNSKGTLYSLSMGLNPFVEMLPASGGAGAPVLILGNGLTGTKDVSFNGTAATFTVVSDSEIQTTVPAGAVTGAIQVTTPSTTLASNLPFQVTSQQVAATPIISPAAGTYASAQTATITDATAGAAIYYTTDGSTPTTASNLYSGPFPIPASETLQAIATSSSYSASSVTTAAYTIQSPSNPAPVLTSLSPTYTIAGSATFTLTVNGSAFTEQSVVYWGTSALATQFVSATELTAQISAAEIATAGTTAISVETPTPGGGTSATLQFDEAPSGQSAPAFTTLTAFVNPGSTATYPVTLPSTATNFSVTCLNLPSGASCSYSLTGAVAIATSSTTPLGTYQITVVFTETVPGAATSLVLPPFLLLSLAIARKRCVLRGTFLTVCLGFALMFVLTNSGCGGGSGGGGSGGGGGGGNQTHQATSTGAVTLIVQ